ncbi:MAG TPA: OB-fold domain-containing protein [Acidimicrobiales bacterium]|nr:OB-fold domain-containing protein [Acidimicrobiales bacterium]
MTNAAAFSGAYVANLGPSVEGFLLPAVDEEALSFWEGTRAGELRIQACAACGKRRHPPRPMCPSCRSTERTWDVVPGAGTIWSFVVPHPPLLQPYSDLAPYNVIVVELDIDRRLRFVGNLVDGDEPINAVDPAGIRIGEPVEVAFRRFERADGSVEVLPFWTRRQA